MRDLLDVAIVGAGISGLSAAYEAQRRGRSFHVFDAGPRAGGIVQTERVGEFVLDAGPDALLIQKPAALALCRELGLADRLIPTIPPRTAFVLRGGSLHALPEASVLGFPTRLAPLAASPLFSIAGKFRMAAELFVPKRQGDGDESIGAFVRRRFGDEAVAYIAEPLLAGIHAGDVERLSIRALFPRLVDAEQTAGSVIKAFRRHKSPAHSDGVFRSFPNGIHEIIDALVAALPAGSISLQSSVEGLERLQDGSFAISIAGQPSVRARAIILAVPAHAAAQLLRPIDTALAARCESIRYLSTATVVLAYPRDAVGHPLSGTGFIVPLVERRHITAAAWISSKWPGRAPRGTALLRAFLGGARDPDVLSKTDDQLVREALDDLAPVLDLRGSPEFTRVYRWPKSTPQQEVGHLALMDAIDRDLTRHPGLFVSAAGFRGVGMPDCIGDARRTAEAAARFVLQ